jgi:hypothetical protein
MKITQITGMLAISAFAFFSCNDEKKSTSETVTITDTSGTAPVAVTNDTTTRVVSTNGTLLAYDQVPDTIKRTFTTKYPKVSKYEWYSYQPLPEDDFETDQSYYYVRFNDNGADYTTWFDNQGEWVKTSTKVPGNKNLPDAVNRYLNVNYPGYDIEEISKENDKNMDMYEIKLNKGDSKVKLKILPNGKLFKRKSR